MSKITPEYLKERFIKRSVYKFGNAFDYLCVEYVNGNSPITLICKKCKSTFKQKPRIHLDSKHGCTSCAIKKTKVLMDNKLGVLKLLNVANNSELEKLLTKYNISELSVKYDIKYHTLYSYIKTNKIKYRNIQEINGKSLSTNKARRKCRKLNKDDLYELYINQKLSMQEISVKFGITPATVLNSLRRYNIDTRLKNGKNELCLPKYPENVLRYMYHTKKYSLHDIATKLKYYNNGTAVRYDFLYYGIELRDYKIAGDNTYTQKPELREVHRTNFYKRPLNANRITWIEQAFIDWANEYSVSIKREYQLKENWHRYDFFVCDTKILVEMDGTYWHSFDDAKRRDATFDLYAKRCGYKVIRIKEENIPKNKNEYISYIHDIMKSEISREDNLCRKEVV